MKANRTYSRALESYLRGDIHPQKFKRQGYEAWRATVPWTNEQIITALRELAGTYPEGWVRNDVLHAVENIKKTGKFSGRDLGRALGVLITKCQFCEKKALYRRGNDGRCRAHRDIPDQHQQDRVSRLELRSKLEDALKRKTDDLLLREKSASRTRRFGKA